MFYMQLKLGNGWFPVAPTDGKPYSYPTRDKAAEMLAICYPDQVRAHRLGGPQTVRVAEECPSCGSINPHQAERDGHTGLCDNCQCV